MTSCCPHPIPSLFLHQGGEGGEYPVSGPWFLPGVGRGEKREGTQVSGHRSFQGKRMGGTPDQDRGTSSPSSPSPTSQDRGTIPLPPFPLARTGVPLSPFLLPDQDKGTLRYLPPPHPPRHDRDPPSPPLPIQTVVRRGRYVSCVHAGRLSSISK